MKPQKKQNLLKFILLFQILLLMIFSLYLGYNVGVLLSRDEKIFEGCWVNINEGNNTNNEWICINVNNISYSRLYEICRHEIGHSIFHRYNEDFASMLEKNETKFWEIIEELE